MRYANIPINRDPNQPIAPPGAGILGMNVPDIGRAWGATSGIFAMSGHPHAATAVKVGPTTFLSHAHQHLPDLIDSRIGEDGPRILKAIRPHEPTDLSLLTVEARPQDAVVPYMRIADTIPEQIDLGVIIGCGTDAGLIEGYDVYPSGSLMKKRWAEAVDVSTSPVASRAILMIASFKIGNSGFGGLGSGGDSGAPVFSLIDNSWQIIGLLAFPGPSRVGGRGTIGYAIPRHADCPIIRDTIHDDFARNSPKPTFDAEPTPVPSLPVAPSGPQISAADLEFLESFKRWVKAAK